MAKEPVANKLRRLTPSQQALVGDVIDRLLRPVEAVRGDPQPPFTTEFVRVFGEALQLYHALSDRHLSKDNFESALVRAMNTSGQSARYAPRGNAGYDVELAGQRCALKTQADSRIKRDLGHISKYMELGKGDWTDEASLTGLRDRFLAHLEGYDRIVVLRYFRVPPKREQPAARHDYELVEIPKPLLMEAAGGTITMKHASKQSPKPGY